LRYRKHKNGAQEKARITKHNRTNWSDKNYPELVASHDSRPKNEVSLIYQFRAPQGSQIAMKSQAMNLSQV